MKLTALLLLVGLTGLAVQSNGSARSEGRTLREALQQPAENIRSLQAEALLPECDPQKDSVVNMHGSVEGSDSCALTPTQDSSENSNPEMTAP